MAGQWLAKDANRLEVEDFSLQTPILPPTPDAVKNQKSFHPSEFFIPGWHGEGLISTHALRVRRLIEELEQDASSQFQKAASFAQTRKQQIFEEFLCYQKEQKLDCAELSSFVTFWTHLTNPLSVYRKQLDKFSHSYAFRSVLVYINKVRFIVSLSHSLELKLTEKDLGNFNHFLTKIFIHGSSSELQCDSLRPNHYSWYCPSQKFLAKISELKESLVSLSVTELNKIFTHNQNPDEAPETPEANEKSNLKFNDQNYSHSLSHKHFGLFLNQLMIQLPLWLAESKKKKRAFTCYETSPTLINTKFVGHYLSSLSASHWMAQEHNLSEQWDKLICPDFTDETYAHGVFFKICHELQFLTFLLHLARYQGHEPLGLICRVMKEKYSAVTQTYEQIPLLINPDMKRGKTYQRILVNLTDFPKTNPHHHLVTRISHEARNLDKNGYLLVMSNQKLFVPSHADKVEQLLKSLKLAAHFSFDNLKGKGEIPSFLYVFTKRTLEAIENTFMPSFNLSSKESCLTFRWSGDLTRFSKFETVVKEFSFFLNQKNPNSTPIYQKETDGLCFDFHQDSLFEGKLLSTNQSKSSTHITHPSFFKNLAKACVHFEEFFQIENVQQSDARPVDRTSALLGIPFSHQERYPLILIADFTKETTLRLELVPYESYPSKLEQYGSVYYHYFGLTPKRPDIDINTFKEFFESRIGVQVIQLCLSGGPAKLKSKLRSLLVPKFFTHCQAIDLDSMEKLQLLKQDSAYLLSLHPSDLKQQAVLSFNECCRLSPYYPWHLLSLLSAFKVKVLNALSEVSTQTKGDWNFTNPLIIEPLLKLHSRKIYTENEDIYLEFLISEPSDFSLPLTDIKLKQDADNFFLELRHDDRPVLRLYGDKTLLEFIRFIFNSALGTPISQLIQNCSIPRAIELKSLLENFAQVSGQIEDLAERTENLISDLLQQQISKSTSP